MAVAAADIAFARELFADLGPVTTRKMFGGASLYVDGVIFAILDSEGQLYLKAKDAFADRLAAAGSQIFTFEKDGVVRQMGYWTLPSEALDDPDMACQWAREALDALGE